MTEYERLKHRAATAADDGVYQWALDEIDKLNRALGYFLDLDPENPFAWKYKREKADAMARELMEIGKIYVTKFD